MGGGSGCGVKIETPRCLLFKQQIHLVVIAVVGYNLSFLFLAAKPLGVG